MNKITILHILSGDTWGGSEAQVHLQLKQWADPNFNQSILLFNSKFTLSKFQKSNILAHTLDETNGTFKLISDFFKQVSSIKPDIIITHDYKEAIIASLYKLRNKRVKLINVHHGSPEKPPNFTFKQLNLYTKLHSFSSKYIADTAICVSKEVAKSYNLESYEIIPNCFEAKLTEDVKIDPNSFVIVGRLEPVKQVELAIDACVKTSSRLYIIGNGSQRAALEKIVTDKNASKLITFLGFRDNPYNYIKKANGLIICSKHEGMPTVVLEALKAECPIISTKITGVDSIMQDFTGYLYYSSDNLSDAIKDYSCSKRDFKWDKSTIDQYSPENTLEKYLDLYKEILKPS